MSGRSDGRQLSIVLFTNSIMMGGMEQHILSLGRGLAERGIHVAAICPSDEAVAALRDGLASAGVEVHALSAERRNLLELVRRLATMAAVLRRHRPFILHLHNTGSDGGALPMLAAKLAGAEALVRTEHQPPDQPVSARKRALIRFRDRFLDRIVCVSRANLEEHLRDLKRDRRKFVSIPNCIDLEQFSSAGVDRGRVRDLVGAGEGTVVVGTLGRLAEPRKGVEFFVDMARMLSTEGIDYKFVVVGDGPRRSQLEERAAGSVVFLGRYPDAAECYAAMDVYVQASLWEGGPITVLEAMAMERPVVATDVGMVAEAITDGLNGRIVPPGDAGALAAAVREVAADQGKAHELGRRAREAVATEHANEVMTGRLIDLYDDLCPPGAALASPSLLP